MCGRIRKYFKKVRLLAIFVLAIFLFNCGDSSGKDFKFVFMTDIHIQPEQSAVQGFNKAITRTNNIEPDFVLTGGDMIMDALGQTHSRADSLYDIYKREIKKLNMPVYNTLGNHEVFGLYEDNVTENPDYGKAMFKSEFNREQAYYSFDHKGWHFMVLDPIATERKPERRYYGKIDSTQIEWIKRDLSQIDRDTPIVVSSHIGFYSIFSQAMDGGTEPMSESTIVTNNRAVLDLFEDYNLKLVLQGHLHTVEDIKYKGTRFITAGAVCGRWWEGPRAGFEEGFAVIEVNNGEIQWHYEDYGWTVPAGQQN